MEIMAAVDWKSDYIGKKALLRVSVSYSDMTNVPAHHIEYVRLNSKGLYEARGFAIVTILEAPSEGTYIVRVGKEEVTCGVNHLYRILLDDEPEPEVWKGQPRLA
jgi:hypothetical protein